MEEGVGIGFPRRTQCSPGSRDLPKIAEIGDGRRDRGLPTLTSG